MTNAPRRGIEIGFAAALLLFIFYIGTLALVSGRDFARSQLLADAGFLAFLIPSFGTQVGLYAYLRAMVSGTNRAVGAAAGASGTMSGASMVACCAHYVPTMLPLFGVSAAATVIMEYRLPLLLLAVASNLAGLAIIGRAFLRVRRHHARMAADAEPTAPPG